MLEIEQLEVRYGRVAALQGVDISVRAGEAIGVVGPNGAGKSTLLASIAGLLKPAAGRISFDGDDLAGTPAERIVRRGVALVPEGRRIFGSLTVRENLRLAVNGRPSSDGWAADLEDALGRLPKLRPLLDTPGGKLSGGEQQMLAIARALLCRPRLLMLDEPSLGLAPLVVDTVFDVVEDLRREGTTILLVEQNVRRTLKLVDRAYVLRSGRVVLSGTREELSDFEHVTDAYLGAVA